MPDTLAHYAIVDTLLPPAREAWHRAAGGVSWLYRALDANATHGAWWCRNAAREFRRAARHAAEPQRTQLHALADRAAVLADPLGSNDDKVRALIDAAAATVAALERAALAADAEAR